MMTATVGPWGSEPEYDSGLQVLSGDEAFSSEYHQGHAEPTLCKSRPDIRLPPHFEVIARTRLAQRAASI